MMSWRYLSIAKRYHISLICKPLLAMAGRTGLEPATSGVTGRRSNQLNYRPRETTRTNIFKEPVFGIKPTGDLPDKSGRSNQLNYRPREKKTETNDFRCIEKKW